MERVGGDCSNDRWWRVVLLFFLLQDLVLIRFRLRFRFRFRFRLRFAVVVREVRSGGRSPGLGLRIGSGHSSDGTGAHWRSGVTHRGGVGGLVDVGLGVAEVLESIVVQECGRLMFYSRELKPWSLQS